MKIKASQTPALVHLQKGWYVVAGTIQEVDGRPHLSAYVQVPPETRLEDIEFVRDTPETQEAVSVADYIVKSSDGHSYYTVIQYADGSFTCSCPGFSYRKKCRHIYEVA